MKRVVVTGGAGFIGSHLCDVLVKRGDDVICVDNLFTGSKNNIEHLRDHHNFEFVRHDLVEPIMLEADEVYHLACPASPVHYQFNPVKTIKINVLGTMHMLGLAKRIGAKFLLASTSEVYGDPQVHPQREDYWGHVNPIGPRSCYDEGKRVAETLAMNYRQGNPQQGRGVEAKIVRIFNTYGPRMLFDDGRVVSNFIVQSLKREPLTIYGRGTQTRCFCYVDDLVRGLIATMDKPDFLGPVNLGSTAEFTIHQLAEMIKKLTGTQSAIEFRELPQDDPTRRRPDTTLAKTTLGWEPTVEVEEGLRRTIADFQMRMGRGDG